MQTKWDDVERDNSQVIVDAIHSLDDDDKETLGDWLWSLVVILGFFFVCYLGACWLLGRGPLS